MANGFHGPQEEWDRLEGPLIQLDPILATIATEHDLSLRTNHKSLERSLLRETNVRYLLQVFVAEEQPLKYNVWICASQFRDNQTYWKEKMILRSVTADCITETLIRHSIRELLSWKQGDLEPSRIG